MKRAAPGETAPPAPRASTVFRDLLATDESGGPVSFRLPRPGRPGSESAPDAAPLSAEQARRDAQRTGRAEQRSLFLEIMDWMLVPLLLLWPLSVGVTFVIARSLADAPFDRALLDRVEVVAQQVRASHGHAVPIVPRLAGDGILDEEESTEADRLYLQVVANDGELMVGDDNLPRPSLYDFPETDKVKLRNELYDGIELRVGYLYVDLVPGGDDGQVLVQVGEPLAKRNRLANEIIKGVIFPQFVILPGAVLLVWFGLTRGLAPLKLLQERIRARNADDPSPIDPRGAPEEVGPLIDAFNDLLMRQGQSVRAQKRFIADAAHQIKTPLAGLQTQAEMALREHDPEELRRSLDQLLRSAQRAGRMVSQLLAMARAEHLRDATAFVELDLAALARDTVGDWVPQALSRDIDVAFEAPEDMPLVVNGNPVLLREALSNLIDNALRYTPRGGAVTVRLAREDDTVVLDVTDTGPGVPPAERELVFERFYRVLGTQVDGSGLGLSIVREIAEQHGATISVGVNPAMASAVGTIDTVAAGAGAGAPTGARFELRFPLPASWQAAD